MSNLRRLSFACLMTDTTSAASPGFLFLVTGLCGENAGSDFPPAATNVRRDPRGRRHDALQRIRRSRCQDTHGDGTHSRAPPSCRIGGLFESVPDIRFTSGEMRGRQTDRLTLAGVAVHTLNSRARSLQARLDLQGSCRYFGFAAFTSSSRTKTLGSSSHQNPADSTKTIRPFCFWYQAPQSPSSGRRFART